jgi:hypothetical protein
VLDPSLRAAVISAVGRHSGAAEFDQLLAALGATESEEERSSLLGALSKTPDAANAQRLLDEVLADRLPPSVRRDIPGEVAGRAEHRAMAYEFAVSHWLALAELAGDAAFGARAWILPGVAWSAHDEALADRLLSDQRRLMGAVGDAPAQQAAEGIRQRARLREREARRLPNALAAQSPP